VRSGARASPSPGTLINHITGNRKSLYQLMQACCKPDTGEITQQLLRTSSDPARRSPFQVGVGLVPVALKASAAPASGTSSCAPANAATAGLASGAVAQLYRSRRPAGYPQPSRGAYPGPKGPASHVNHRRLAGDTSWRTCLHPMMERHMLTSESSYFDFLMKNRGIRRTPVPFAQAVGVLPELARAVRLRRPALQPKAAA
jgi:hypothetical protein